MDQKFCVEAAEGIIVPEKQVLINSALYIKCKPEEFVVDEIGLDGNSAKHCFENCRKCLVFSNVKEEDDEIVAPKEEKKKLEEAIPKNIAEALRALNDRVRLSYNEKKIMNEECIEIDLGHKEKHEREEIYKALDELVFIRLSRREQIIECRNETRFFGLLSSADETEKVLSLTRSRMNGEQVTISAPTVKEMRRAIHQAIYEFRGLSSTTSQDKERIIITCQRKKRKRKSNATGEFVLAVLKKCNAEGLETVRRVSHFLGLQNYGITIAGIKDKRGITYQFCVIDVATCQHARQILAKTNLLNHWGPEIQVSTIDFANKPMQLGALTANSFRIIARYTIDKDSDQSSLAIPSWPSELSFTNYYGSQRVGNRDDFAASWRIGRALLQRNYDQALVLLVRRDRPDFPDQLDLQIAKKTARSLRRDSPVAEALNAYARFGDAHKAMSAVPFKSRIIWIHAYQSRLFNAAASQLQSTSCENETTLIPLVGAKTPAEHQEQIRILTEDGITLDDFKREKCNGAHRPLRATATHLQVNSLGEDALEFTFRLPPGAFATVFLSSLCKELRVVDFTSKISD